MRMRNKLYFFLGGALTFHSIPPVVLYNRYAKASELREILNRKRKKRMIGRGSEGTRRNRNKTRKIHLKKKCLSVITM